MIRLALLICFGIPGLIVCKDGFAQKHPSDPASKPKESKAVESLQKTEGNPHLAPLSEDEVFFSAPTQRKSAQSASKSPVAGPKRQEVRLLGVGRVGRSEADETHAILKVDGKQLYRRIGESIGEIEVVDIGRRSVTLQSHGDRWTIELFEQPLLESAPSASLQPKITRNNTQRQTRRSGGAPSDTKLVAAEPLMPTVQALPTIAPVEAPALPDLELPPNPQLPDFSKVQ